MASKGNNGRVRRQGTTTTATGDEGLDFGHEFEAFCRHKLAPELHEGAPPPPTWGGPPEAWERLRQAAATVRRGESLRDFAAAICRGWTASELAEGSLSHGSVIDASGRVIRPPVSELSAEIVGRVESVLEAARVNFVKIGGVAESVLRAAVRGAGTQREVTVHVESLESAVRQREIEQRAARDEVDARARVRVLTSFRGPGGRAYALGLFAIEADEMAMLREWEAKLEAMRDQHNWDDLASVGFPTWPVFEIIQGGPEPQRPATQLHAGRRHSP